MSKELSFDELYTLATEGVALTVVSTFGLVGNTMSIYVLARMIKKGGQGSFSVLLLGLASFDALFLLTAILAFGMTNLSTWYLSVVFPEIMVALFGLIHTFRIGSVFVTVFINCERFCAIVYPLKHFSMKKYLLPMAIGIAIIYNVPKFFELEMRFDPTTNTTEIFNTALRKNSLYVFFYVVWSKIIFMELFPYCTIVVCNVFIIIKTLKSARFRSKYQSSGTRYSQDEGNNPVTSNHRRMVHRRQSSFQISQKEEDNLSFTLVLMSIIFITCQSFKIVPDIYELIFCGSSKDNCEEMEKGAINVVLRLSHLLVCFNSSANFLVYYLSGRKFRAAWMEIYGCKGPAAPNGDNLAMVLV